MAASVIRTCDVEGEGTPAVQTHHFTFEGAPYVLDLGEESNKGFEEFKQYWLQFANPDTSAKPSKAPKSRSGTSKPASGDTATLRAWAKANGWPDLGERGRIPQDAKDAFIVAGQPGLEAAEAAAAA